MTNRRNQNQQTALETIVIGIFHVFVQMFKLIFGLKTGRKGVTLKERTVIVERREKVDRMLKSANIHELIQAVFEADKLVYYLLDIKGYEGESFAEKLRSAEKSMDRNLYNELWQGHKIRNQLAHEADVKFSGQVLKSAAEKLLRYAKNV